VSTAVDVLDRMIADTSVRLNDLAAHVGSDWGLLALGESSGLRLRTLVEVRTEIRHAEMRLHEAAVCNRCGAPKGMQVVGESCDQNCGGRVVASTATRREDA
jgi:hypothetical protein